VVLLLLLLLGLPCSLVEILGVQEVSIGVQEVSIKLLGWGCSWFVFGPKGEADDERSEWFCSFLRFTTRPSEGEAEASERSEAVLSVVPSKVNTLKSTPSRTLCPEAPYGKCPEALRANVRRHRPKCPEAPLLFLCQYNEIHL